MIVKIKQDTLVESFRIGDIGLTIVLLNHNSALGAGYKPWVNGCGISKSLRTLQQAREISFKYIKTRIESQLAAVKEEVLRLNNLQEQLGSDVFNLGEFKEKKLNR